MAPTHFTLNTGAKIPSIGLGTWQSAPGAVETAVHHAISSAGYTHVDCAFGYGNEGEVGSALAKVFSEGKLKREDIFVTTKLWSTWHSRAAEGLDASLAKLGLDYVDLFLMHWPVALNPNGNHPNLPTKADGGRDIEENWDFVKTWKAMEALVASGKVKAIGVSNFSVPFLTHLLANTDIVPAVNQIENHPLLPQNDIVELCRKHNILITAYSPLGSTGGPLLQDETVKKVAEKHNVGVGNVLLNYHVNRGVVVLAKSVTPERITENKKLVTLDQEDMDLLESMHKTKGTKRFIMPPWPVNFGFPDWDQSQFGPVPV
ncbi:NADP-dependent oxidoreductase domain-containing protein [Geopyxis carbonaria]|nr:NADP-dependent oxidoreductase domain-containing protein [Geopyxis carbonaria]